jgi:hypothetical protein
MNQAAPLTIDNETLRRRLSKDEQKNEHKRRYARHKTFIVARLVMMSNSSTLDGVINEMSQGGMRFRPASLYLQKRDGETVSIVIGDTAFSGRIRASRPDGYGIQLLDMLDPEVLESFVSGSAN